jgi:hypothetical protein
MRVLDGECRIGFDTHDAQPRCILLAYIEHRKHLAKMHYPAVKILADGTYEYNKKENIKQKLLSSALKRNLHSSLSFL